MDIEYETTAEDRAKPARPPVDDAPSFSFIVPCYNEEKNLAGTRAEIVKAAAEAGLDGFEIIAVDDGSTDGTGAVIARLAEADPRVPPGRGF